MYDMPFTGTYNRPMRLQHAQPTSAAPVRHIDPRPGQEPKEERFWREDHYRPQRRDRYNKRRPIYYEHDRDDRRKDGYKRDEYERDYSPDYDRRRDDRRYSNDKETRISDVTKEEGIFAGKSIGKQAKSTTKDQAQTPWGHH